MDIQKGSEYYIVNGKVPYIAKVRAKMNYQGDHGLMSSWVILWEAGDKSSRSDGAIVDGKIVVSANQFPGPGVDGLEKYLAESERDAVRKLLM